MSRRTKHPRAGRTSQDDPAQSRLFIKIAREVGADDERPEADAMMGQLHKKKPRPHKPTNRKDQ